MQQSFRQQIKENQSLSNTDCCFLFQIRRSLSNSGVIGFQIFYGPLNFSNQNQCPLFCFRFDLWFARSRFLQRSAPDSKVFRHGIVPRFDATGGCIERERVNNSGIYVFFSKWNKRHPLTSQAGMHGGSFHSSSSAYLPAESEETSSSPTEEETGCQNANFNLECLGT